MVERFFRVRRVSRIDDAATIAAPAAIVRLHPDESEGRYDAVVGEGAPAMGDRTERLAHARFEAPRESVITAESEKSPELRYTWPTVSPLPTDPSPNAHAAANGGTPPVTFKDTITGSGDDPEETEVRIAISTCGTTVKVRFEELLVRPVPSVTASAIVRAEEVDAIHWTVKVPVPVQFSGSPLHVYVKGPTPPDAVAFTEKVTPASGGSGVATGVETESRLPADVSQGRTRFAERLPCADGFVRSAVGRWRGGRVIRTAARRTTKPSAPHVGGLERCRRRLPRRSKPEPGGDPHGRRRPSSRAGHTNRDRVPFAADESGETPVLGFD